MANNVIEIRPDGKNPADLQKCKLFFGETEITNIQPLKLFNDHGRLILKAEIHFAKSFLQEQPEEKTESKKSAKKGEETE